MTIVLETPPDFSFRRTVASHGWCLLPPFAPSPDASELRAVVPRPRRGAVAIGLRARDDATELELPEGAGERLRRHVVGIARRILALDVDLTPLHAAVAGDPRLGWIATARAGRLLRAATAFEDLVKLVLTTNCSWALTTRMTAALCELYGERVPDGRAAFPRPRALATVSAAELRERARLGYRAPFIAELARRVVAGELDPEAWHDPERPVAELEREMLALPGVGPYVAENLLKLLGRPDGLALDSWMRAKYARLYHGGRRVTDRTIARRYARLGAWAGIAVWLDLTRDWVDAEGTPAAAWDALE